MVSKLFLTSAFLFLEFSYIFGRETPKFPEELNKCLSSDFHKLSPSRNDASLAGECKPWSERSCCKDERAAKINADDDIYNLKKNLCGGKDMSEECKKYFKKDACFFECSPNLGLWIDQFNGHEDYQRFKNVPLCKKDCEEWFNACSNDNTCTENWFKNEEKCPKKCQKISSLFKTAKDFCEKVWDDSYKVMENNEDCMTFTFDAKNNTNDLVAKKYYSQKNSASNIHSYLFYLPVLMLVLQYIY